MVLTARRFTVDEFTKMADAGVFGEEERVELIDGEVIRMAAQGDRHVECVEVLNEIFVSRLSGRAAIGPQNAVRLTNYRQPQPDIAILKPRSQRSRRGVPAASDILLVIEVADTSLDFDRNIKRPRYAEAGIPECWIINLVDDVIEVSRDPAPNGYRDEFIVRRGDRIAPVVFPNLELEVSELIPSPSLMG